jgi:hypothetical protein
MMTIAEMLSMPTLHAAKPPARYLLRAFNPVTGQAVDGRYLTMKAALAKVAELLPDDCSIEIWSSATLEGRTRTRPALKRNGRTRMDGVKGAGRSHGGH